MAGLTTTNQAYTMVQGVLQVFRRRLEVDKAIRFLSVLPLGVPALFVVDWDVNELKRPVRRPCHHDDAAQKRGKLVGLSPFV